MTAYQSIYTVLVLLPLCKFCTQVMLSLLIAKRTVKAHPTTGHEGPQGQWRYTSTLYLSLALDGVGGQHHAPTTLPLGNDLVPIVQKAGLTPGPVWVCVKNIVPTGIPELSSPLCVTAPTILSWSTITDSRKLKITRLVQIRYIQNNHQHAQLIQCKQLQ